MQVNTGDIDLVTIASSIIGSFVYVKVAVEVLKVKAERLQKDMDSAFVKIRELEKIISNQRK